MRPYLEKRNHHKKGAHGEAQCVCSVQTLVHQKRERERERERENARYNHTEKPLHPRWTKRIGYFQELSNYNKHINESSVHKFIYYENFPLNLNLSITNKPAITLAFN
jgi:hypothetical protein